MKRYILDPASTKPVSELDKIEVKPPVVFFTGRAVEINPSDKHQNFLGAKDTNCNPSQTFALGLVVEEDEYYVKRVVDTHVRVMYKRGGYVAEFWFDTHGCHYGLSQSQALALANDLCKKLNNKELP